MHTCVAAAAAAAAAARKFTAVLIGTLWRSLAIVVTVQHTVVNIVGPPRLLWYWQGLYPFAFRWS